MIRSFDVCLRGDGPVGRSLALLLARERLKVALIGSPQPAAAGDVRVYALNSASRQLLEDLRAWPSQERVTPVQAMQVWGDQGGQIRFEAEGRALAWLVPADALQDGLAQALHFAPQVTAEADPADVEASLQVVCEGRDSSSRAQWGIAWDQRPYGQKALAARLQGQTPHGGLAMQWFTGGEVIALLPAGGADACERALVWSVAAHRADDLLAQPPEAFMAALNQRVGGAAASLSLCSPIKAWPLRLACAGRWVGPGWALAGDAAHTVHPLAGQGLNLGLGDARELARVISEREFWRSPGDLRLLRRYERSRKAAVGAMGLVTDGLQGLFSHEDGLWPWLRNRGMTAVGSQDWIKSWLMRQAMG